MTDILTIISKELKELWLARGSARTRVLSYLPVLMVFGVLLPLQQRELWVQGPVAGIFAMLLPTMMAGGLVADSFAGERERHTLETLLATRLADRDIFVGKVIACVLFCLGLAWVSAVASLITLNVTRGSGPLFFFSPSSIALAVIGGILLTVMTATIGVFVSLRAPTVRAAAQVFSLATMAIFFGVPLLLRLLPVSAQSWVLSLLEHADSLLLGAFAVGAAVLIDVLLLALGIARFQRKRLILE